MASMESLAASKMTNCSTAEKNQSKIDSQFILNLNTPVIELNAAQAFENLTQKEKLYSHYYSKASWYGSLICLFQGSPESPLIYSLVLKVFGEQPIGELEQRVLQNGVTQEQFQAILVYACGILTNLANYKSFGDSKFVPGAPINVFEAVIQSSYAFKKDETTITSLWERVKPCIYSLTEREKTLGFPDSAVTTYLSSNCKKCDAELISRFLQHIGMEAYNSRAFKGHLPDGNIHYEIRLASAEIGLPDSNIEKVEFDGAYFSVTRGDYAPLMQLLADYLEKAKEYAANQTQEAMLGKYIESFRTGSLDAHKDGSRFWVKDKGPIVETYIGFIETYRDPAGERADFTGWVAMVNKERSANFLKLVESADSILVGLPWDKSFEKDIFLQPDFTSLDVLTFAHSDVPAGINIPNYDCIRQNEGYKNVSLGNVISSSFRDDKVQFLSPEDEKLFQDLRKKSFEVQVGLHELFGHGSGKLFKREVDGKFNFDVSSVINPLTGGKIDKWYEATETYDSKFTTISSSYEECRAEAVGLYLCSHPKVLKIFGYEGKEAEDIVYVNWLSMMWNVIANGPESYSYEKKCWLQAHARARYVLLRVLMEAGDGLLIVKETEPGNNLLVSLDRSKISTVGMKAVKEFLLKLQVYKSMGDIASAEALYNHYSVVPEEGSPWANWRKIAFMHLKPRRMFVQPNTEIQGNNVLLKRYEPSFKGIIQSWAERFSSDVNIHKILDDLWWKDRQYFHL
ncbi:hypothetical protein RUM44_001344 [Polyplax serrata]|uniref:Dipeptidyl peptidase 3 n=1 Tax=Polyplax serrata TaxID=468196 RepID=A0ABR1AJS6_POLSC